MLVAARCGSYRPALTHLLRSPQRVGSDQFRPAAVWGAQGLDTSRQELQELLGKPALAGIPLLVLGNKNDLPAALSTTELIDRLELKAPPPPRPHSTRSRTCTSDLVCCCFLQSSCWSSRHMH